jgi:hypothetical protein
MKKTVKRVCECKNCGNEAEMVVTCSLPDMEENESAVSASGTPNETQIENRVMGTATCTHCGNEADMWVDL